MSSRYAKSDAMLLDINSSGATTAEFEPLPGATRMTFFCVLAGGSHNATVVTPQVSPDGVAWFDLTDAKLDAASGHYASHECICLSVRFKVTTVQGSPATCNLYVFSV